MAVKTFPYDPFAPVDQPSLRTGAMNAPLPPGATPPFAPRQQVGPPAPSTGAGVGPPAPTSSGYTSGTVDPYARDPRDISNYPPEVLVGLLGTQGDVRDLSALEKQLEQANALRNDWSMPEGRSSGRVYTAANPLEFIGKGMQTYAQNKKAKKLEGDTEAKRKTIKEKEQDVGRRYFESRKNDPKGY